MSFITKNVDDYYYIRALKRPNAWEALGWAATELGEVYEVLLSWDPEWIRNNPEDHPKKSKEEFAEELGDVIMMVIMAGLAEGVDPVEALEAKMRRKLESIVRKTATMQGTSGVVPISAREAEEFGKEDND